MFLLLLYDIVKKILLVLIKLMHCLEKNVFTLIYYKNEIYEMVDRKNEKYTRQQGRSSIFQF